MHHTRFSRPELIVWRMILKSSLRLIHHDTDNVSRGADAPTRWRMQMRMKRAEALSPQQIGDFLNGGIGAYASDPTT